VSTHEHRLGRARLRAIGVVLLLVQTASAGVMAQTYQSGGSTAVIEQQGGGRSQSEVTVYRDGQKVITRDGQNTDISIQRGPGSAPTGTAGADSFFDDEELALPRAPERSVPRRPAADDAAEGWLPSDSRQDIFRERMIDRMRRYSRF
jgi:hypothetical protein